MMVRGISACLKKIESFEFVNFKHYSPKKNQKKLFMKRKNCLLILAFALCSTAMAHPFAGGDGSQASPYQITSREQLDSVRGYLSASFVLNNDIVLTDTGAAASWRPIATSSGAPFVGHFDGRGHQLTGMYINIYAPAGASNVSYYGLFGTVGSGAVVENVRVVGGSIKVTADATHLGFAYVGGIVGYIIGSAHADTTIIRNCYSSVSLTATTTSATAGTASRLGGIVGYAYLSDSSTTQAAPLVLLIDGCSVNGSITNSGLHTGGIAGQIAAANAATKYASLIVSNCFSRANIVSTSIGVGFVGGIVGLAEATNGTATDSLLAGYPATRRIYISNNLTAGGSITAEALTGNFGVASIVGYVNVGRGTTLISGNVCASESIVAASGRTARINGYSSNPTNTSSGKDYLMTRENNVAYANTLINGLPVSASATNGDNFSLADLYKKSTYTDLLWDFDALYLIREGKSFPYPPYLSAPVAVTTLTPTQIGLDADASIDSVLVYRGTSLLFTIPAANFGSYTPATALTEGEPLSFVAYQTGKELPSYSVLANVWVYVNGVTVSPKTADVLLNGTGVLTATVLPTTANIKSVTWTSSNTAIAEVADGLVTGKAVGTAQIIVTTVEGGYSDTSIVTVKEATTLTGDGSQGNPYIIANADQLVALSTFAGSTSKGKYFSITADINLTGAWTPVGDVNNPFYGKLLGNHHQISNLNVNGGTAYSTLGLFGVLGAGARVENLHIASGTLSGGTNTVNAGVIAAQVRCDVATGSDSVTIVSCSNAATLSLGDRTGVAYVGSIVGFIKLTGAGNSKIVINACANFANITSALSRTGGLVGGVDSTSIGGQHTVIISNSYNAGHIENNRVGDNTTGGSRVGGILGHGHASKTNSAVTITKCYAIGNIHLSGSTNSGLGGVGYFQGSTMAAAFTLSYSVSAHDYVEGLYMTSWAGRVANRVSTNPDPRIFIKNYSYDGIEVTYHDGGAADKMSPPDNFNGLAISMEALQQQATYTDSLGWDLTSTWAIADGKSYPYLQYQTAPITDGEANDEMLKFTTAAANTEITVYKGIFGSVSDRGHTGYKGYSSTPLLTYTATTAGLQTIPLTAAMDVVNGTALHVVAKVNGKAASYPVRVIAVAEVRVRTLTITANGESVEQKSLINGQTLNLDATIEPADALDKSVTWTSTNTAVASVDQEGIVTGLSSGTTLIIVSSNSQPVADTCTVNVLVGVESITFSYDAPNDELEVGKTLQITATVLPESATDKSITWSSSTPNIATVDNNGLVTATQRRGAVIITATANDGSGVTGKCNLMVVAEKDPVTPNSIATTKETLLVYPNPVTNGQLIVAGGQWKAGDKVELYDLQGRLVLSTTLSGVQATVNIATLPQGAYIVKLGNKTALIQKK
jgi:uncharacterized protein YjdB